MTNAQQRLLHTLLSNLTIVAREDRLRALSYLTKRELASSSHLTDAEFRAVVDFLQDVQSWKASERTTQVDILTRPPNDPWAFDKPAATQIKEAS